MQGVRERKHVLFYEHVQKEWGLVALQAFEWANEKREAPFS
jgi:hypothetical protein